MAHTTLKMCHQSFKLLHFIQLSAKGLTSSDKGKAKPCVNRRRFAAPQMVSLWNEVKPDMSSLYTCYVSKYEALLFSISVRRLAWISVEIVHLLQREGAGMAQW